MQTNEFYFLILVCGAFGLLMVTLALGSIHDRNWAKQKANKLTETRR